MAKHKLYDLEIAPPPGVWDKIAAELDESELSHKYPSLLNKMEVPPPAQSWQQVAAALDEFALVQDYSQKLSGAVVTPPAGVWDKIESSLDSEVVPTQKSRRIAPWVRYAAAAAVLAFMAWGGLQLFNKKTTADPVADNTTTQTPEHNTTVDGSGKVAFNGNVAIDDIAASLDEARDEAALEASKKTFAKLDVSARKTKVKNAADFAFMSDDFSPTVSVRGLPSFDDEDDSAPIDVTSNRYIVLFTPEGNIIRMSKKLRDLVCCVSGEDVDKACIDQMKKWREKIASPAATHSPGNFLDILSMVHSLQDN